MGLLRRGRDREIKGGIEGTAKIVDLEQHNLTGKANDGDSYVWEEAIEAFGKSKYELELEVTVPGREPYRVRDSFKVPAKAERTGLTRASLSRGLELPVRVDPSDQSRVEVDWDRFAASPDRRQALDQARQSRQAEVVKQQLSSKPEQQAQFHAQNRQALAAWVGAVKMGNMSREEFDETVQLEVDSGRMDPADAEAARKTLDG